MLCLSNPQDFKRASSGDSQHAVGLDPFSGTRSERWIRCTACPTRSRPAVGAGTPPTSLEALAVRRSLDEGKRVGAIVSDLGLTPSVLADWHARPPPIVPRAGRASPGWSATSWYAAAGGPRVAHGARCASTSRGPGSHLWAGNSVAHLRGSGAAAVGFRGHREPPARNMVPRRHFRPDRAAVSRWSATNLSQWVEVLTWWSIV